MNQNVIHQIATVFRTTLARLRFIAVFVVAALVIGNWESITNHVDRWTRPAIAPDSLSHAGEPSIEYYCPMHPTVIKSAPGKCPICGMELVKRLRGKAEELPPDVMARLQLTPKRVALAGIQTSLVEPRELLRELRVPGIVDYDETKVARISARVAGRADELFVKSSGQTVQRGDPIYSLYSPEVYTAQREYLLARKRVNELGADAGADVRSDANAVYNASMQKLVLWGISTEQLDRLDHEYDSSGKIPTHLTVTSPIAGVVIRKEIDEGNYVAVGQDLYTVADLTSLWLQARIFEQDVPLVQVGQSVDVVVDAIPNETFVGTLTFLAYQLNPETRTLDARIVVDNSRMRLRAGMFATAHIRMAVGLGNNSSTAPTTQVASKSLKNARIFADALVPYTRAHQLLSADKTDGVSSLLKEMLAKLQFLSAEKLYESEVAILQKQIDSLASDSLVDVRSSFRLISAQMIKIGMISGVPTDSPTVRVFRCPMGPKPNWLQTQEQTLNPYEGTKMLDCGGPIDTLPRVSADTATTTQPATIAQVLAVPRDAVVDTGRFKIVYVQSATNPGIFDMRAVKLGPLAGDFYPVVEGLTSGERVVSSGAFLVDAEMRLNPGSMPVHQH